jgi:hypothetical protein
MNNYLFNKKYIAFKNNPNFIKKYKKKFIYDHNDKNNITLNISNNLFNQSLNYLSQIQNNIYNSGIENYLSGGAALKLYTKLAGFNDKINILQTNDFDLYLYFNERNLNNNKLLINKLLNIINVIVNNLKNKNYTFLEYYILIDYNKDNFNDIIKLILKNGFDLYLYDPDTINNIYKIKFLKLYNKEFCLRLKFKFMDITNFKNENIYSYIKMTHYYISKNKNQYNIINKYTPIEILIKNKNISNINIMKSNIYLNNNIFYIYNENTLLYNLMHLYYKYNHNTNNKTINIKKEKGKDKRDLKRLNYFFKIYCHLKYPYYNVSNIDIIYKKLLKNNVQFKNNIENIKNFDMINNILKSINNTKMH